MKQPARCVIIRHGETEWNRADRMQGHLDSPLTERGHAQARAAAEAMRGKTFQALYSSDLGRAMQTAEYLQAVTGLDILPEPRLREKHMGIFQGLTREEIESRHPEVKDRVYSDPDYQVPEGESIRQRHERVIAALEDIVRRHPGETILIVAHGGVVDSVKRHLDALPLDRLRNYTLRNAGITTVEIAPPDWHCPVWDNIDHLAGIDTLDDDP